MRSEPQKAAQCLFNAANLVKTICVLISPFMPATAEKLEKQLNWKISSFEDAKRADLLRNHQIGEPKPLFTKVKLATGPAGRITLNEFQRLDLRIGKVLKAERIPDTKRLLKLEVDLGSERRTLVAGIGEHYEPENLIGKNIVVLANLKETKIRGVLSQGMLLAAEDGDGISLLVSDREVRPGSKVK
jgi:methionyl-tRNA synthetase